MPIENWRGVAADTYRRGKEALEKAERGKWWLLKNVKCLRQRLIEILFLDESDKKELVESRGIHERFGMMLWSDVVAGNLPREGTSSQVSEENQDIWRGCIGRLTIIRIESIADL